MTMQQIQYGIIWCFLTVSKWLPLRTLRAIGNVWGSVLFLLPGRARSTTIRNLQVCFPNLRESEIAVLAKESLRNTACTAMEMGKAWLLPMEKTLSLVSATDGGDAFEAARASGKGVILLAPHLSNWEIFGFALCHDVSSTWLYQPAKIAPLDALIQRARSRSGMEMVPTDRRGVARLLKALQAGAVVGILPDQVPADESGEYAPFFGEQAFTMTLVSKLIKRTGARVFCGFARRLPGGQGFKIIVREADPMLYSDDLVKSVTGLNKSVEQCVKLAVSQYQWEYKRFRRLPDGTKFY